VLISHDSGRLFTLRPKSYLVQEYKVNFVELFISSRFPRDLLSLVLFLLQIYFYTNAIFTNFNFRYAKVNI
jgi:hypothetical protein